MFYFLERLPSILSPIRSSQRGDTSDIRNGTRPNFELTVASRYYPLISRTTSPCVAFCERFSGSRSRRPRIVMLRNIFDARTTLHEGRKVLEYDRLLTARRRACALGDVASSRPQQRSDTCAPGRVLWLRTSFY